MTRIVARRINNEILFFPVRVSGWDNFCLKLDDNFEDQGFKTFEEAEKLCNSYDNPVDDTKTEWDTDLGCWTERKEPSYYNDY